VFNWLWSFNSGKETAHEWYCPKEWFHEAIQKLSRRRQWCVT
jgi:hypothetical protein